VDAPLEARRAVVSCVLELARAGARHQELYNAGIINTLKHICDNSATMSPSTGPGQHGVERQVREQARAVLDCIEHGIVLDRTL
jgi:hypothetical protein